MADSSKGGRGKRDPNALRRMGKRLPPVRPEIDRLLDVITAARGGTKAGHIERALIMYADIAEAKAAGLVED